MYVRFTPQNQRKIEMRNGKKRGEGAEEEDAVYKTKLETGKLQGSDPTPRPS